MKTLEIAQVVVGAGLGGGLRHAIGLWANDRWAAGIPWHTFAINIAGAFLLGILMAATLERNLLPPTARIFLGVGLLGGFTTFSTLSYESITLLERGLAAQGFGYMFGSAVAGILAVIAGLAVGRAF